MEVDLHPPLTNRNPANYRPNVVTASVPSGQNAAPGNSPISTMDTSNNRAHNEDAFSEQLIAGTLDHGLSVYDPALISPEDSPATSSSAWNPTAMGHPLPMNTSITTETSSHCALPANLRAGSVNSATKSGPIVVGSAAGTGKVASEPAGSTNRLVYSSERHPQQSLESMNNLLKNKELCDVVLLVDGREIFTHRVVLAACSPYFKAMFTGELAESRQTEVTLYDLDGDAVETLVQFCYTGQITVEESNVQFLLPAACLLQLTEAQEVCCEFLKRQLDPTNCLGIRAFADTHACRGLLRVADQFTLLNFLEVVESEEFLLLPVKQLADLLGSDELSVRNEEQVYRAVMRWVNHNLAERRRHLACLMQHVRLPLLSPKFLVGTVGSDLLMRSDERCRDLVDEAKNYLLLPQERPLMQGPRTRPRKPIQMGELLFAVGGWCSGDAIASAEHYDPRTHEWHLVAPMHKRRCGVGVGVINDLLYAVGGHDGQSYLNSVERYDPHTNQWSADIAPTSTCRTSVGVAVLNGFMYAVGGQDGVSCLNFVERFDPVLNKWIKVSSMASRRLGVGVAVLNNQLYAVGGSDGQQPLSSVEHYDPRVGCWHRMPCMGTRRKHLGVAVYNGLIYAVGGRDEVTELSSAECFDPRTRTWSPVVAMTSRRSGVGLAVVNNQLIAIGGFDGATYLKTVEIYDPDAICWRLRGSMNSRRLGGGVGVVRLARSAWTSAHPSTGLASMTGGGGGGLREDADSERHNNSSLIPSGLSVSVTSQPVTGGANAPHLPSGLANSVIGGGVGTSVANAVFSSGTRTVVLPSNSTNGTNPTIAAVRAGYNVLF